MSNFSCRPIYLFFELLQKIWLNSKSILYAPVFMDLKFNKFDVTFVWPLCARLRDSDYFFH
jgi:hypothetical protein